MDKSEGFFHILCIMIFFTNEEYLALSGIYSQKKRNARYPVHIYVSPEEGGQEHTTLTSQRFCILYIAVCFDVPRV